MAKGNSATKNAVLTTVIDDFYDVEGSTEEHECFIEAVKRWDPTRINSLSDNVKIPFSALYNTVNDIAQNACVFQGRDVSTHLKEIWYRLVMSMMKEAEWAKAGYIPSMQDYLENGKTSMAWEPIVLIALFFVGHKLSEQVICHHEYTSLMELVNICGRLLNDIQSYKREAREGEELNSSYALQREAREGKLNYVTLFMKEYSVTTVENVTERIRQIINQSTQKLLRNLLQPSVLPSEFKKLYWTMVRVL